ncbi:MAG: HDOD domain-containing protein [Campylobacterales bacterium]|nr:HDOD domain-containing protein [Campylobacterales bacterium]
MGFESIVGRIHSLPPLPESIRKIQTLYLSGDPDVRELVKIVESDPVMSADLLARMNAPAYGFSRHIVSVMQAVTLIGLSTLRGFVLSSALSRTFTIDMRPYGVSTELFKQISTLQSALMFQWYMGVDIARSKDLVPLSFMMEMGKVVIAKEVAESAFGAVFQAEVLSSESISETERFFAQMSSCEVCALLFEHWHFSELFCESIRHMDDPSKAPESYIPYAQALDVVQSAVGIGGIFTEHSLERARTKLSLYGLQIDRFMRVVERLMKKMAEQGR